MADNAAVPVASGTPQDVSPPSQVRQWGRLRDLSSLHWWEISLANRSFERMPWLAVAMFCGICAWFALPGPSEWIVFIGFCGLIASGGMLLLDLERYPLVRTGLIAAMLVLAVGLAVVWGRSALVGDCA